jgi:hypothetical protein
MKSVLKWIYQIIQKYCDMCDVVVCTVVVFSCTSVTQLVNSETELEMCAVHFSVLCLYCSLVVCCLNTTVVFRNFLAGIKGCRLVDSITVL